MEQIENIINDLRIDLSNKSDFELRENLLGLGFTSASIASSYFKASTIEYTDLYNKLYALFTEFYQKASKDTIRFDCIVKYKSKTSRIFEHQRNVEERNIDEAIERVKQKNYYNLDNNRKINNPIFVDIAFLNN
jgi:hypothetical protein